MTFIRCAISALPDLALGLTFLLAWRSGSSELIGWIAPSQAKEGLLPYLLLVMLLEFIVIHSAAFMGLAAYSKISPVKKTAAIVGLGAFYSTFVVAFALGTGSWWPFAAFWGLTLNRLAGALVGAVPEGDESHLIRSGWVASAGCYLLFLFATVMLPVPRFGITEQVVAAANLPGEGLWVEEPHRVVALGTLYFLTQTVYAFRPALSG